jgi:GxxExxY protein
MLYEEVTSKIIKAFYNVYNTLGTGFLENVYEKALLIELKEFGLKVEPQKEIEVFYKNKVVGKYRADIVVENKIIIELKAVSQIVELHKAQLINYLKATNYRLGFLVNFGDKLEFKRIIFEKKNKKL